MVYIPPVKVLVYAILNTDYSMKKYYTKDVKAKGRDEKLRLRRLARKRDRFGRTDKYEREMNMK